ncbi:glycoside hydrolase family 5 protein [Planosporangium flavigriseum]|uniref:glycoside hydrolase family 5 protein n=1 Tax=Planosporangium flavigriseum TaxID=373681 RepID=UPI00143A9FA1|nr:cellulase family glycosylhydrolase [Planosporangium flavigriseum]NJC65509.1 glycoside hydrolase family 5 protein [Planosporangium flavigriseum]
MSFREVWLPPSGAQRRRVWCLAASAAYVAAALGLLAVLMIPAGVPLPAVRKVCTSDALEAKAVAGLANFAGWLRRNGTYGFIGEVGWPSNRDSGQWNRLADTWYTAADRIGLPVTAWAAGSWPADYPMAIYRSGPDPATVNVAGPQAAVVERHGSTDRYPRGVNLAYGSFGAGDSNAAFGAGNPGRYGLDYGYEVPATYHDLAARGVRLVRLAVNWERLQPVPFGPLSGDELARVRSAFRQAGQAGLTVLLDLHGYGDFFAGGGSHGQLRRLVLGSPALPTTALADFWQRTAQAVADMPAVVAYGILNEPTRLAAGGRAGARIWERASQQAVDAIRRTGATAAVMISGYLPMGPPAWGQMHPRAWIRDPLGRVAYESHAYFDSDGSGRYLASYADEVRRVDPVPSRCQWLPPLAVQVLPTGR